MESKVSLKITLTLVFAASALTCLILSLVFYWQISTMNVPDSEPDDFSELLGVITSRFIGEHDTDEITYAALRAAVESLDDNWSYYMSPQEYADFLENSNNRYVGIGVLVVIDEETEGIKVLNVYHGSGADLAGIVVDDIITAVDGESILGLSLSEVKTKLRRPIDETALLTVLRADGEYHELTVVYSVVFINPVSFEMLDGYIGYVRLVNFEYGAADRFISAVNELIEQGAVAFVYDVRSNPGGRVNEMTEILDFLLPEGEIFVTVNRSDAEKITMSDAEFIDMPAVVLVNSYTFSGAEYFAAILSEYEYAVIIGDQTTGKNRMQSTISLSNGGAIHLSTGQYLTKNRVSLFDVGGLTPNYTVSLTEDEFFLFARGELKMSMDPQVQKAISLVS